MINLTSIIFVFVMFELYTHVNCANSKSDADGATLRGQDIVNVKKALIIPFKAYEKIINERIMEEGQSITRGQDKQNVEQQVESAFPANKEDVDYDDIKEWANHTWTYYEDCLHDDYYMLSAVRKQLRSAFENYKRQLPEALITNGNIPLGEQLMGIEKKFCEIDNRYGADKFDNFEEVDKALGRSS